MLKNILEPSQGAAPPRFLQRRKSLPQPLELLVSLWHHRKRTRGENSFSLYSWLYFIPALPLGDGSRMSPLACALFGVF